MICVIKFICVYTPNEITGRWRCLCCYSPHYPLRQGPSLNPKLVWHSSWLQLIPPIVRVTDVPCHARNFYVGVWDSNSHPRAAQQVFSPRESSATQSCGFFFLKFTFLHLTYNILSVQVYRYIHSCAYDKFM